ncbi:MAG TPA: LPS assembly protein LptD [Terriglobia bacterium]|nr:LPS assembly protein LptD [Terriglobia bacterium]
MPNPLQAVGSPETVEMRADAQERDGDRYRLRGHVEIAYGAMLLTADEAEYDASTGELTASGAVHFTEKRQQASIRARRARYNLRQATGHFEEVEGSIGGTVSSGATSLTTTNPYYFQARSVERIEEETYRVYDGTITVCAPPRPTWTFSAPVATIRTGSSVRIQHAQLRILGFPVFYLPYVYRSLGRIPRTTGLLMPTLGNNSRLGIVLGDSFYWAINRSMDAEIGAEYLSKRGWSQQGTFRMRPTAASYLTLSYYGVSDRGFGPQKEDQGGRTARAEGVALLPGGFRGVVDYNYLSSLTFREAFAQTYTEAVNSEIHSAGFLSRNAGWLQSNILFSQIKNFQSRQPGDNVQLRILPSVELNSTDRPLWEGAPLWISWESSAGWISRKEPAAEAQGQLRTTFFERLEFHPQLTLPLRWRAFRLTPALSFRATHYGAGRQPGSSRGMSAQSWQRGVPTFSVEWILPPLAKLYQGAGALYAGPFRHVIEPRLTFRYVNDVGERSRVLLFDVPDLAANTRELEFSLTNRILVKGDGTGAREALAWELKQQYYFDPAFGGALIAGQRNVLPSSLLLSGHAYLDGPRRFSPVVSLLRFHPSGHYDVEFRQDYDPLRHRFVQGGLTGNARLGEAFLSVNHTFVRSSPALAAPSHQVGFNVGYGNMLRRGWNAVFAGSYDVRGGFMQFTAVQASYNNDCCGVSFEYRRFALGPTRNENQFRMAFSLANVGTFGTLKKQERLF